MIAKLVSSESRYVGDLYILSDQYYQQVKLAITAGLIPLPTDLLDTIFLNWLAVREGGRVEGRGSVSMGDFTMKRCFVLLGNGWVYSGTSDKGPSEIGTTSLYTRDETISPKVSLVRRFHCRC